MEDALITILESFKYPVYRQGSMSNDAEYPETFITFWNNTSDNHAYYDNDGATIIPSMDKNKVEHPYLVAEAND